MRPSVRHWFPENFRLWGVLAGVSFPAVALLTFPDHVWRACFGRGNLHLDDLAFSTFFTCGFAYGAGWFGCALVETFDLLFARPGPKHGPEADYDDEPLPPE